MRHEEMSTLVGFLKGAFPRLTEEQVELYSAMLMYESAALASKAILDGIKEWRFPPTWAEINERIAALKRAYAPVPVNPISVDVEDYQIPRWVRRWCYARYLLKPPDLRLFQESYPFEWAKGDTPVEGWMPPDQYAKEAQQVSDDMVRVAVSQTLPKATLKELLGGP